MADKLLITGAGGFIGSHLTELCVASGYRVKAFVHYSSRNHWGWLEESPVKGEIELVMGDVRDFDSVYDAMTGCNDVLHLAALIGIPYSYVSPLAYVKTNVEGTYNILQSARLHAVDNVVITSTSETYGTAQYVPIDERHPAVGQSPYAASKVGADQLAISYYRSFKLPVTIARPFNTFGPRQSARAFIPTCIGQLLSGTRELRLGNVHPTRDFTFVKDTAQGFLALLKTKGLHGEAVNIGTNTETSMGDLVRLIADLLKLDRVTITADAQRMRPENSEVERLVCDNRKILQATAWRPEYSLQQGLEETIAWLRAHTETIKSDRYVV